MKATKQYFPMVLFIMLYKTVLTFESVDEILECYHSNESYWAVLSCGTVYYAVQGGSNFWVCGWNPRVLPFKWKLPSSTFPVLWGTRRVRLTSGSLGKCYESYSVLSSSFAWYYLFPSILQNGIWQFTSVSRLGAKCGWAKLIFKLMLQIFAGWGE